MDCMIKLELDGFGIAIEVSCTCYIVEGNGYGHNLERCERRYDPADNQT